MSESELKAFLASDFGSPEEIEKIMNDSKLVSMGYKRLKTEREERVYQLMRLLKVLTNRQRHSFFFHQICSVPVVDIAQYLGVSSELVQRNIDKSWEILKKQKL